MGRRHTVVSYCNRHDRLGGRLAESGWSWGERVVDTPDGQPMVQAGPREVERVILIGMWSVKAASWVTKA